MEPQDITLRPGLTFVAPDGPYKDRLMTLKKEDATKPGQDRWIIETDDGKEWGAPGARLRVVLAAQAQEEKEKAATKAEADAQPAPSDAATQAELEQAPPPKGNSAEAAVIEQAPMLVAAEKSAPAPLEFAQVPVKLLIWLSPDKGEGRMASVGADLPDHNAITASLTTEQVAALLPPLAEVLAQLETEFPERRDNIIAALDSEWHAYTAPVKTIAAPTARSKAGRTPSGTPLTTVPDKANTAQAKPGISPERQAYLASLHQTEMFVPTQQPTTTAPTA